MTSDASLLEQLAVLAPGRAVCVDQRQWHTAEGKRFSSAWVAIVPGFNGAAAASFGGTHITLSAAVQLTRLALQPYIAPPALVLL
jgi:hypothetical protein